MALSTGTPLGTITTNEEISLEGAPNIYFQDSAAGELYRPDADGYYWGLSGTATYPVYQLGCYTDVALGEDVEMNVVRCDTVGDKDVVQKRNYLELTLTLQHFFPFEVLRHIIKASAPATSLTDVSKMGIGKINNTRTYHVYMPKVYDEDNGDYVLFHLHRAKFVDAFSIRMSSGENWSISGIKIRAFADELKPENQMFATVIRADASVL